MAMQTANEILKVSQEVPISSLISIGLIGIVPILFISTTSYLKVSVVLSILRSALGGGQIPSQAISGVLALLISLFTISPVLESCFQKYLQKKDGEIISKIEHTFEPLLHFVRLNAEPKERLFFYQLERRRTIAINQLVDCEVNQEDLNTCLKENESFSSLLLAFVSGELRSACLIGVCIFLPFLVIDLIISTLLTGLGMMMVSPVTITMPIKLLVFVLSDGWSLLINNLIIGYKI